MTSIRAGKIGPTGPIAPAGGSGGGSTHRALDAIAADVAARIARELELFEREGRRRPETLGQDLYGIDELAARLAEELGASPAQAGEIGRALHHFAAEVAARVGAAPDSRSVEEIAALLAERATTVRTADEAIALIRRAASDLSA